LIPETIGCQQKTIQVVSIAGAAEKGLLSLYTAREQSLEAEITDCLF